MEIDLDRALPVPDLVDPEDCKSFKVVVRGSDYSKAKECLEPVGRLESRDVAWISVAAVEKMAGGRVGPSWSKDFAAMLAYARIKGWLDEGAEHIQGHCEWVSPAG